MRQSYYYSNQDNKRVYIKEIDEQQYKKILSSVKDLNTVVFQLDYYLMVYLNFIEFLELYNTCNYLDELSFVKHNCLYNNLLNSYYILWEYIKNYNLSKDKIRGYAEGIKNDETCLCALAIRNYGVHNSQIIKGQKIDLINNTKKILIDLQGIISDKSTKETEIMAIKKRNLLESREFAIELINKVKIIMIELMKIEEDNTIDSLNYILSFLPSTNEDRFNTFIMSDEEGDVFQIGLIIKHFDKRMKLFDIINEKLDNDEFEI